MLNILVCVKQVPDVNLVRIDPETGSLIREGVPSILNPLDAYALEAALQVRERYGGTVTCMTMGPDMAEAVLRECLASGADSGVLLSDRAFANADTLATSYVIASAAEQLGSFDLIFCGKESLDGATGQMGSQLAERLDASQLSCVSRICEINWEEGIITAERELEKGTEVTQARLPCLLTVEKTCCRPRIPAYSTWRASRTAEITRRDSHGIPGLDPDRIGDPGSPTKVPRIYPPAVGEKGLLLREGSARANAARLLSLLDDLL